MECESHQDASFEPLTALVGPACKKLWPLFRFINSRPMAAMLDAILDLTAFQYSDFGRFLVCYSPPETVPETVKKTFSSNFFGVQPYFYSTIQGQLESHWGWLMDPHWGLSLRVDVINSLPLLEPGTWVCLSFFYTAMTGGLAEVALYEHYF